MIVLDEELQGLGLETAIALGIEEQS